jgi:hypothetical protein
MHRLSDLRDLDELEDVRLLWFCDYYDGPVAGLALFAGREYWFSAVWDEQGDDWTERPRRYTLHEWTEDQARLEWDEHRRFAAEVGGPGVGCLHDPPCPTRPLASESQRQAWYERHPWEGASYADSPVVGWFVPARGRPHREHRTSRWRAVQQESTAAAVTDFELRHPFAIFATVS